MKNVIKFSHEYPKLYGQRTAELLAVRLTSRDKLDPVFVEYDTRYYSSFESDVDTGVSFGHYALPNGLLLVLVFLGAGNIPFTTVRRATARKRSYYESKIGCAFEVVIVESVVEAYQCEVAL